MKQTFFVTKLLILACSLTLVACGGGSSSSTTTTTTTPTTTTITGKAEAPNGMIAQFEGSKPIFLATIDFIFPAAGAAITGLQPVGGATVELIRIDNDGNQIGAALASTVTSITGNYSLALPTGVSLAGDLIVRISGTTASMSAMVVDQTVNINPISQFVLDKFVDVPNLVLADLAINEVVSLSGKVEEFDLTATADLSTMLAQLEAEVGQFVDIEVAVIDATPDDGTASAAAAGNWHIVQVEFGMEDHDDGQFAALSTGIIAETELMFEDNGNGDLTISDGLIFIEAFTDYATNSAGNRFFNYGIEINGAGDGDSFPAVIDADSNISISFPFEESLDEVGPGDMDGPDFGDRSPPGTLFLNAVADGNTYIASSIDAEVGYFTIDTNNDGVKDAVNPADRRGDNVEANLLLGLRQGSGMTVSSINGDFGLVSLGGYFDTTPQGIFDSTVGEINLNDGIATKQAIEQDTRRVIRTPATPVTLNNFTLTDMVVPELDETFPYTVSATGQVTLDFAGDSSDVLEGFTNADGSVIAFVDSEATGSPVITSVINGMVVSVKLGTAMTSSLNGASYRLLLHGLGMEGDGYFSIYTLGNAIMTFDADAGTATLNATGRGFDRANDIGQINVSTPEEVALIFTVNPVASNGAVTMSTADAIPSTFKGFVSADSNLLIMRLFASENGGDDSKDIGIVIGIKQ